MCLFYHVKGRAEVKIGNVEALVGEGCIFNGVNEVGELSMCAFISSESLVG